MQKKTLIIYPSPAPYSNALFNKLAADSKVQLDVAYGFSKRLIMSGEWEIRSNYKTIYLDGKQGRTYGGSFRRSLRLLQLLFSGQYSSTIFHGLLIPEGLLGIIVCIMLGIPYYLRTDTNSADPRNWFKRFRNKALLPWLVRLSKGIIVIGTRNREFWQAFGLKKQKIHFTPYAVDDHWWKRKADSLLPQKKVLRQQLGFNEKIVLLAVTRLSSEKGLNHLIKAINAVSKECPELLLAIVGAGPEEKKLRSLASVKNVRFEGFKAPEEVSRYYAAADVFILPSIYEPWGLVVNEAMFFKLPLICTSVVGSVPDLVQNGRNGLVVEPSSHSALVDAIRKICIDRALRQRMGKESQGIIDNWSGFNRSVKEMLQVMA